MEMNKKLHFLSGVSRSGSTVLCSILNQNPEVYVTPTSPLLGLLLHNQDTFFKLEEVIANPMPEQLINISRGMIEGAWAHRPEKIIIDKHRAWIKNLNSANLVLGEEVKVVATIRDLPSVMASWLTLIKKYPYEFDKTIMEKGYIPNDENRMAEIWFNRVLENYEAVTRARKAKLPNVLFVDYDDFVEDPKKQVERIVNFLELPSYDYSFENIKQEYSDDLKAWGFPDLHKIRPEVKKISKHPEEVLGEKLYNRFIEIEKQYDSK